MQFLLILAGLSAALWVLSVLPWLLTVSVLFLVAYLAVSFRMTDSKMSTRRKLMAATWSAPSEGTIYGVLNINAEPLIAYLDKLERETGQKVTVTTAVLKALAFGLKAAPGINCRLVGGSFVPRASVDVSCLVALEGGKDLANAKIERTDELKLTDIQAELKRKADKLRNREDKDFEATKPLLKMLPTQILSPIISLTGYLSGVLGLNIAPLGVRPFPFGSAIVTSVGMLGVEQAFVPFTPFAHVPLLVMVGAVAKRAVVIDDQLKIQSQMTLTVTLDHRFADGTEAARMGKTIKQCLENPELLDNPTPQIASGQQ